MNNLGTTTITVCSHGRRVEALPLPDRYHVHADDNSPCYDQGSMLQRVSCQLVPLGVVR